MKDALWLGIAMLLICAVIYAGGMLAEYRFLKAELKRGRDAERNA